MANTILWIYIGLLLIGGLVGFLKAGSKISLITSVIFAAALAVFASRLLESPFAANALLAVLLVVFVIRYAKGRKFMPSGLLVVLTFAALILRFLVGKS
jgi:uncharacterized membrane protein (UPF0136 family)